MLLSAEHLSINFGSRQLLDDVNFYLNEGDKTGVIGINGTGKSTFLKVLAGVAEPDGGTITKNPNVQVSFLAQNPAMEDEATVLEQVFLHHNAQFRELNEYEAKRMLNLLGIPDFDQKVGTLSGGQRKRVALAAALLHPADVLVLDEPTNHLDSEMVTWLEDWLRRFRGGLVMVTHDRYFLQRVVNHITELDRGKLYHYEANYEKYLELKAQRAEMAEASERKRQSILRVEREWIMRGCKARTTKSKERIDRYEALLNQEAPQTDDTVQLAAASSRLGRKIIELHDVTKGYEGKTLIDHFSYNLLRSDRIGIVGHNGAGKSTVLNIISRLIARDSGLVDFDGRDIGKWKSKELAKRLAILTQSNNIQMKLTVRELVTFGRFPYSGSHLNEEDQRIIDKAIAYMELEPFQDRFIDELSGGQRQRAYIAMVIAQDTEFILLDEPTNNLDIYHATNMMKIVRRLCDELGKTVILVLHEINYAAFYSDYICAFKDGRIAKFGTVEEVMTKETLSQIYQVDFEIMEIEGRPLSIYY